MHSYGMSTNGWSLDGLAVGERDPLSPPLVKCGAGHRQVPMRETDAQLPYSPLAGEMPKAEGGPVRGIYLVLTDRPPSVTP